MKSQKSKVKMGKIPIGQVWGIIAIGILIGLVVTFTIVTIFIGKAINNNICFSREIGEAMIKEVWRLK